MECQAIDVVGTVFKAVHLAYASHPILIHENHIPSEMTSLSI